MSISPSFNTCTVPPTFCFQSSLKSAKHDLKIFLVELKKVEELYTRKINIYNTLTRYQSLN